MIDEFLKVLEDNGLKRHAHQERCVSWCAAIENEGQLARGFPDPVYSGIIADEMGLGKTLQMIGLIVTNVRHHTLIVLPRALLGQWTSALQNLLGHTAFVYHGQKGRAQVDLIQTAPVVITTYGTLAAEMSRPKTGKLPATESTGLLGMVWDRVIFDEAHHMRNRSTRVHRSAAALQASHKWLLTGTPLQNSISDIRSLCYLLGFTDDFVRKESNLAEVLQKFMMRRTVEDVGMRLPALVRHTISVPWESPRNSKLPKTYTHCCSSVELSLNGISETTCHLITSLSYSKLARLA